MVQLYEELEYTKGVGPGWLNELRRWIRRTVGPGWLNELRRWIRRTDTTMVKRKKTKVQTTICKTLHRKLKIEQHKSRKKNLHNFNAGGQPHTAYGLTYERHW